MRDTLTILCCHVVRCNVAAMLFLLIMMVLVCCNVMNVAFAQAEAQQAERKKGTPALPYEQKKCPTASYNDWNKAEQFVWNQVCLGKMADFNDINAGYGGYLDPKTKDKRWEQREIRPEFLETILLHEPWRSAVPRQGVGIMGAWFTKPLDLFHAELIHLLGLVYSRFESTVNLVRLQSSESIDLTGSVFVHKLDMNSLEVKGALYMRHGKFAGVELVGAQIGGQLSMVGVKVSGTLNMESLDVKRHLLMRHGKFADVELVNAQVGWQLDMSGAKVRGTLDMNSLEVKDALAMRHGKFADVELVNAQIGGQLDMSGAKVSGTLDMNGLEVKGALFMRDGAEFADVELVNAQVGGQLSMVGAKVSGTLNMESLDVKRHLLMRHGKFAEGDPSQRIVLLFATLGSALNLEGAELPSLNLTGSRVSAEFRLDSATKWRAGARLILRNTTVGALQDAPEKHVWPEKLDLKGFTYASLGGLQTAKDHDIATRDPSWFIAWLRKDDYSPQPYEQLARVLRQAGRKSAAKEILYAEKNREWETAGFWRKVWLFFLCIFIGYGYRSYYAIFWILGLILVGFLLLRYKDQGPRVKLQGEMQGHKEGRLADLWYSIDLLLPIIQLRKSHYDIELEGRTRDYFYVHQIMGYVLATVLIAWLSGLLG